MSISFMMQRVVVALACLACAGHGQRFQDSNAQLQSTPTPEGRELMHKADDSHNGQVSHKDTLNPSKTLSKLLLSLSMGAAFNPAISALPTTIGASRTSDLAMSHHVQFKGAKKKERFRPRKKSKKYPRPKWPEFENRPIYTVTGKADKVPTEEEIGGGPGLMGPKQRTWYPKGEDLALSSKKWYVVDAENMRLGRMAGEIVKILMGKNSIDFTPGRTIGDYVIVVNAEKIVVTGKKAEQKIYRRHSGRPGGMKVEKFKDLQARIPERIVEKAVAGMLPKNRFGRELFRHLKVYKGPEHPHAAQEPIPITFGGLTSTPDLRKLMSSPLLLDEKWQKTLKPLIPNVDPKKDLEGEEFEHVWGAIFDD